MLTGTSLRQPRTLDRRFHAYHAGQRSRLRAPLQVCAALPSRTDKLRELLAGPDIIKGPCCHDGISARLIEKAGFDFAFMSGFCTSAARLGAPDTGLISYYEMVDQGRYIHEATKAIPIIGDGDTGYGNAINVKRTVKGYAAAGFAGILVEDQISPKSCGHVRGKKVTSREEAVSRIKAAVDARDEGADILIVARTDARQAESLEEALWRAEAFAAAGADVLFIDALGSVEEMQQFCDLGGAAAGIPKMANMLEGGGKTPILSPDELQAMGFKLVAYPLSLLGVSVRAMQDALQGLKLGRVPGPREMGTFVDLQMAVGFPEYYDEEERYAISTVTPGAPDTPHTETTTPPPPPAAAEAAAEEVASGAREAEAAPGAAPEASAPEGAAPEGAAPEAAAPEGEAPEAAAEGTEAAAAAGDGGVDSSKGVGGGGEVVEADQVLLPGGSSLTYAGSSSSGSSSGGSSSSSKDAWDAFRRSKYFRVKITDDRTGMVKLETRIPAGFIGGLTSLIPQVSGLNFEEMIENAMGNKLDLSQPLVDYQSGNDVIQVYLE